MARKKAEKTQEIKNLRERAAAFLGQFGAIVGDEPHFLLWLQAGELVELVFDQMLQVSAEGRLLPLQVLHAFRVERLQNCENYL